MGNTDDQFLPSYDSLKFLTVLPVNQKETRGTRNDKSVSHSPTIRSDRSTTYLRKIR